MATVRVGRTDARERRLPLISVSSGRPAAGYAPAGRPPYLIRVPLTQDEFDRVQLLKRRQRSALYGGVLCIAFGIAMARFPVMLPLGALIGVVSGALWVACWLYLRRLLPTVEPGPGPDEYTLRGVHEEFASAMLLE